MLTKRQQTEANVVILEKYAHTIHENKILKEKVETLMDNQSNSMDIIAQLQRDKEQLHEALDRAADDLNMIARVENNYLAKSGAERCRATLKATEDEDD